MPRPTASWGQRSRSWSPTASDWLGRLAPSQRRFHMRLDASRALRAGLLIWRDFRLRMDAHPALTGRAPSLARCGGAGRPPGLGAARPSWPNDREQARRSRAFPVRNDRVDQRRGLRIEQAVEIAAAPKNVWTVMTDVERWPEWTASVTSVALLDGPPLVVGSRVRIRQPRLPTAVWTVTAMETERYFEWRSVAAGLTSTGGHHIERSGDGCRVILSLDWKGWLTPLINLVFGRLSKRYVQTEAEGLKRRCEASGGAHRSELSVAPE
jgi:uncharacterized membrane protein